MSYGTPPRVRQLPITNFVGPSAVPSQEAYIAPVPPNAPKKKARYAPSAGPAPVPVVCPPYMKPRDLVKNLYPLVHMRQINPLQFTRDGRFKSNPNIPLFFDVVDLSAIPDHILQHKPCMAILGLTEVPRN